MNYDFCFFIQDMPATTPRAYRTIITLLKKGYSVMLVYNNRIPSAERYNKELLIELQSFLNFCSIEINWPKQHFRTIFFKVLHRFFKKAAKKRALKNNVFLALSHDYTPVWQMYKARKIEAKIYAGHRPSVLPVMYKLSKKNNAKTWFDIEDFHNRESTNELVNTQMNRFLARYKCDYYTNASALIGEAYKQANHPDSNSIEVLNAPIFTPPDVRINNSSKPSFVWFSQYIDCYRGLELFVEALKKSKLNCVVHLIGNMREGFRKYLNESKLFGVDFKYYSFIPETQLLKIAASTDFGLALERNDTEYNREIAITNKIITYAVCGNYIIATKTKGQTNFMKRIPNNGILVEQKSNELTAFLEKIPVNIEEIRLQREQRIENTTTINWQKQEKILLQFVEKIF